MGNSGPHIRAWEWERVGGNGGPVDPSELDLRPVDPGYLLYITDEILPIV